MMSSEEQKQREYAQLSELRTVSSDFAGLAIEQRDRPDFLVRDGSRRIGVELAEFPRDMPRKKGPKDAEIDRLRGLALDECRRLTPDLGAVSPLISVHWLPGVPEDRCDVIDFAAVAVRVVLAHLPAGSQEVRLTLSELAGSGLERLCSSLVIRHSYPSRTDDWYPTGAVWIGMQSAVLQLLIDARDDDLPKYPADFDEHWLVIVALQEAPAASIDLGTALDEQYHSVFARVYFYDAQSKKVHRLKTTVVI